MDLLMLIKQLPISIEILQEVRIGKVINSFIKNITASIERYNLVLVKCDSDKLVV